MKDFLPMSFSEENRPGLAIWAITPEGAKLAVRISEKLPVAIVCLSESVEVPAGFSGYRFARLSQAVTRSFGQYAGHIFIMSAGIVVRLIAPHIRHKTLDPAVLVVDEKGRHVISLLSGHIGGANELAREVAQLIRATPVITTATDVNNVPGIDVLAKAANLFIENPEAIKTVSMAFLTGRKIHLHDPFRILCHKISQFSVLTSHFPDSVPGVFIDDVQMELPPEVLILRPRSLSLGMGCNRNTDMAEMKALLYEVLEKFNLSPNSLESIASIDIKEDETGLIALSQNLNLELKFFSREELNQVTNIENPSEMVEKHVGVKSVCEAAAILASKMGKLIVAKHSTRNVTAAIARTDFTS